MGINFRRKHNNNYYIVHLQIPERQKKERKSINRKKTFEKERKEDEDHGLGEEYNCRQMDGFVLLMAHGTNQISNRNR